MPFASTILKNYEQLSAGTPNLAMHRAQARQIIVPTATVATQTLSIQQSGALVLLDNATGFTVNLPPPVAGAYFDFLVTTTSTAHKVLTDAATTFLLGEVLAFTTATASPAGFAFDGSTHRSIAMNGTTTGGLIGTRFRVEALSSTVWAITGVTVGSGTLATPAATS